MDYTIPALLMMFLSGLVGYVVGGSRKGKRCRWHECSPLYHEGYYAGWLDRHHRLRLTDQRLHPDEMREFFGESSEIMDWMRFGDHLPFEDYRAQEVAKLNREMEREKPDPA